jgi:hypothetical protein
MMRRVFRHCQRYERRRHHSSLSFYSSRVVSGRVSHRVICEVCDCLFIVCCFSGGVRCFVSVSVVVVSVVVVSVVVVVVAVAVAVVSVVVVAVAVAVAVAVVSVVVVVVAVVVAVAVAVAVVDSCSVVSCSVVWKTFFFFSFGFFDVFFSLLRFVPFSVFGVRCSMFDVRCSRDHCFITTHNNILLILRRYV